MYSISHIAWDGFLDVFLWFSPFRLKYMFICVEAALDPYFPALASWLQPSLLPGTLWKTNANRINTGTGHSLAAFFNSQAQNEKMVWLTGGSREKPSSGLLQAE